MLERKCLLLTKLTLAFVLESNAECALRFTVVCPSTSPVCFSVQLSLWMHVSLREKVFLKKEGREIINTFAQSTKFYELMIAKFGQFLVPLLPE